MMPQHFEPAVHSVCYIAGLNHEINRADSISGINAFIIWRFGTGQIVNLFNHGCVNNSAHNVAVATESLRVIP